MMPGPYAVPPSPAPAPNVPGDSLQLVGNAEADVLPRKTELLPHVIDRRVVGGIVQTAQALRRILAQARIRRQKGVDELNAIHGKLPQPVLDGFERRDRQQVDPYLEGQADVVEVSADLAVKLPDRFQPRRIKQMLRHAQQGLVCVGFDL
jgi:hypothetical protein